MKALSSRYTLFNNRATITTTALLLTVVFIGPQTMMVQFSTIYGQTQLHTPLRPTLSSTTFPPPILYQLNKIPSYTITIPFSSLGNSPFEPVEVNIPVGMTVIWFNDDNGEHSVTTIANNSYLPPQAINSGPVPASGGSFIHTFSKPGIYNYYDQFDPSIHGRIAVGTDVAVTKNMNMLIGRLGSIPFNPNQAQRVVLSFIPKTVNIPPTVALTYQVTISNLIRPWLTFSHRYDTADGILDLELVPTHKLTSFSANAAEFTT
jgi:plastocyanin